MIELIINHIISEGTENTSTGNWIFYFIELKDRFHITDDWLKENLDVIGDELCKRNEILDFEIDYESISVWFWLERCPNVEEENDDF